jgi:hypothetical protein
MKKLVIALALAVLLLSCDNGGMEEDTEEEKYYTITYHSEGHTSGEVPVDTNRYPVKRPEFDPNKLYRDDELPFERPENGYATIMGPGTLVKVIDGTQYQYRLTGWRWYPAKDNPDFYGEDVERFSILVIGNPLIVRSNINLYADWEGP